MRTAIASLCASIGEKLRSHLTQDKRSQNERTVGMGESVTCQAVRRDGFREYQLFEDIAGNHFVLVQELPSGLWIAMALTVVPQLKVFRADNLERMHLLGQVSFKR